MDDARLDRAALAGGKGSLDPIHMSDHRTVDNLKALQLFWMKMVLRDHAAGVQEEIELDQRAIRALGHLQEANGRTHGRILDHLSNVGHDAQLSRRAGSVTSRTPAPDRRC